MSKGGATAQTPGTTAVSPEVRIEMRSNPLYLSGAREMLSAVARRLGFSEEACGQIALAVDEALCNVIRHGYDRAVDKPIWISLLPVGQVCRPGQKDCATDALRIVIEDEAKQVDPGLIKSRNLEDVRPGGLGVHIIKAVMDEVLYEKRERVGMRLTMIKRRTEGPITGGQSDGCGGPPSTHPCGCGDNATKEGGHA